MVPGPKAVAFISYSREDSEFVLRLARDLRAAGAGVWLDQLDIRAGHSWDDAIESALTDSAQIVLILTPASVRSKNVRDEIAYALDHEKTIVPVLLKDCAVPLRLQRAQQIDFRHDYAAGLSSVLRHLELGGPATEREPPATPPAWHRPTRRHFLAGSAIVAGATAAGLAWNWRRVEDLLHPLPSKRFVALLMNWPAPDPALKPMVLGCLSAIESQLSRAEQFDRNLSVIAPHTQPDPASAADLNQSRLALGANLVLAASGQSSPEGMRLLLSVIDPATNRTLRQKEISATISQQSQLPQRAVQTAATLLGIRGSQVSAPVPNGTSNAEAYGFYQAAEALRQQDNDQGLQEAINNYLAAIRRDPRYAVAMTGLAWAYLRSYDKHGEAAMLTLAGSNSRSALGLDQSLVEAHVALGDYSQLTSDLVTAAREYQTALALDPTNAHTLIYQSRFFVSQNRWEDAESTLQRVITLRPNYWLAYWDLADALDYQGKYRDALRQYKVVTTLRPTDAVAIQNVATEYLQLGQVDEAIAGYNDSLTHIQNDSAYAGLSEAYRMQKKFPEAIASVRFALKIKPIDASHYLQLADLLSLTGQGAEAQSNYNKAADIQLDALRTSPKDGPGCMLMALCRIKTKFAELAPALIAKSESVHAGDMGTQLLKVRILELLNRREDALTTIRECLARGPVLFQLDTMMDLDALRADQPYQMIRADALANQ